MKDNLYTRENYIYITAILEFRTFTEAANKLFVTQPQVSRHIKKIENILGNEIFDRKSIPLKLTKFGEVFYNQLSNIIKQFNSFEEDLKLFIQKNKDSIKIGIYEAMGTSILPLIIPDFSKDDASVDFIIYEGSFEENINRLSSGSLNFMIGSFNQEQFRDANFKTYQANSPLYAIIPKHFIEESDVASIQIASDNDITSLLSLPTLLPKENVHIRSSLNSLYNQYSVLPNLKLESKNIHTLYRLALEGLGITFVPHSMIDRKLTESSCYILQLPTEIIQIKRSLVINSSMKLSELQEAFLEYLIKKFNFS